MNSSRRHVCRTEGQSQRLVPSTIMEQHSLTVSVCRDPWLLPLQTSFLQRREVYWEGEGFHYLGSLPNPHPLPPIALKVRAWLLDV